jgi:hypothetical protein
MRVEFFILIISILAFMVGYRRRAMQKELENHME